MVVLLAMVLLSIVSRQAGFNVAGTDAYAGYMMAAAGFLALAQHAQARRSTPPSPSCSQRSAARCVARSRSGPSPRRRSSPPSSPSSSASSPGSPYAFHDISTGKRRDAALAAQLAHGRRSVVFAIAFVDELVLEIRRRRVVPVSDEAARNE